jgi:hypothetical protein
MNNIIRIILQSVISIAAVSFASFIATVPVLIYHFNQLYLYGLFANLFSVSLMAMAMWAACVGFIVQFFFPPLAVLCMHAAEGLLYVMMQGAALVKFVPWSIIRFSLPYPEIYLIFSLCFLGVILIKKEFRLRFTVMTFFAGLALSLLFIGIHKKNSETQVSFFEMKNSRIAAIKWPNNRAWIIDIGPEIPPAPAYRQYVRSWTSQFMGCGIEKVILPRWKNDAVHFLEPILENEKSADVVCCDSAYARDEDFIAFVRSFKRSIIYKQAGASMAISNQCTCKVVSRLDVKGKGTTAFILKINNSTVFIPDSKYLPERNDPWGSYSMIIGKHKTKVL